MYKKVRFLEPWYKYQKQDIDLTKAQRFYIDIPRKKNKFNLTHSMPKISKNKKRDKILRTKRLVNHLETECYCCGRSYRPYVNFPLVYKEHHCLSCYPEQRLNRYPSDDIPDNLDRKIIKKAIRYLSRKGHCSPTCNKVFDAVDELREINQRNNLIPEAVA